MDWLPRLLWLLVLSSCGRPLWTPPPPTPTPIGQNDRRASLVGNWHIEFRIDSSRYRAFDPAVVFQGTIVLSDTIILHGPDGLTGAADISLPVSCFHAGAAVFPVSLRRDSVTIDFTPNAYDCGLWAIGRLSADTIIGRWYKPAFAGSASAGRFRMVRHSSP